MKKIFEIQGMHCASCAANIGKSVSKIKGIKDVSVNFAVNKLYFESENDLMNNQVIGAVQKLGYGIGRKG
jgi:Cu+-exporting ATPase